MKSAIEIYKSVTRLKTSLLNPYDKDVFNIIFPKYPVLTRREQKVAMAFLHKYTTAKMSEYMNTMEYKRFLNTTYWHMVSIIVRSRYKYHCCICGKKADKYLDTHHLSYEHKGYEFKYLNDLVLVCRNCHHDLHESRDYSIKKLNKLVVDKSKICPKCGDPKPAYEFIFKNGVYRTCMKCRIVAHQYRKKLYKDFANINWNNLVYRLERGLGPYRK